MRKRKSSALPVLGILAGLLALVCAGLFGFLHLPAQRYLRCIYLGQKYLGDLDYEQAVLSFQDAVTIDPKRADGYLLLGNAYAGQAAGMETYSDGRWKLLSEASDSYQNAVRQEPSRADACYNLGTVYLAQGRDAEIRDPERADWYYQQAEDVLARAEDAQGSENLLEEIRGAQRRAKERREALAQEEEPEPVSSGSPEMWAAYSQILQQWQSAYGVLLSGGDIRPYTQAKVFDGGGSIEAGGSLFYLSPGDSANEMRFVLWDMNGDGQEELAVGLVYPQEDGTISFGACDVFAWLEEEQDWVNLTPGNRYLSLLEGGFLEAMTGHGSTEWDYWRYEGGRELVWTEGYIHYYDAEHQADSRSWHRLSGYDGGGDTWIPDAEAEAAFAKYKDLTMTLYPVEVTNLTALAEDRREDLAGGTDYKSS